MKLIEIMRSRVEISRFSIALVLILMITSKNQLRLRTRPFETLILSLTRTAFSR